MRIRNTVALFFVVAALVCSSAIAEVKVGDIPAEFRFKDIRYVERSLSELGESKAIVVMASSTTCPVAQRYLPVFQALSDQFGHEATFVLINVSADDSIMDMAQQAIDYNLTVTLAKDIDGTAVKALGLTRTPEVVVLDSERRVRYRGRVDGQHRVSGVSPDSGRADLALALEQVLTGKTVEVTETPVDGCVISEPVTTAEKAYTYTRDVAPILDAHCVKCHRVDGGAPFSLQTYSRAAAMADMIAEVITEERMPPWYAHSAHGTFVNAPSISDSDRRIVAGWARGGKIEGEAEDRPEAPVFADSKWRIGEPDLVITAKDEMQIPATGYIKYQYIPMPYVFPHDTWIQGLEIRPENATVLHHCNMIYMLPGQEYSQETQFLTGYVPGGAPVDLDKNRAMMIPKGATLVLQAHYVTTGKEERDRVSIGIRFAKEPVEKRVYYKIINNDSFAIPAGDPFYCVTAEDSMEEDSTGIAMFSHMHLRGRDMLFNAHFPDGKKETLLSIPNYDFNWQLSYVWEPFTKKFPKGTRIEVIAHYDNSSFNPYNPDPSAVVKDGPQTFEEMMYGFFFYTRDGENLNLAVNPETGESMGEKVAAAVAP
ncbi:MAG: hypothetical protein AMXMBFR84_36760 [Candidatus Hydrogenedentota bacterium]